MQEDTFHLGIKALIRNKDGKLMLLQVNPKSLKGNKSGAYWDIPGGRIAKGATIEETLKREVAEETGIANITNIAHLSTIISNIRIPLGDGTDVGLILSVYKCDVEDVANLTLSIEHINVSWFDPIEAAELLKVKYPEEFISIVKALQ